MNESSDLVLKNSLKALDNETFYTSWFSILKLRILSLAIAWACFP